LLAQNIQPAAPFPQPATPTLLAIDQPLPAKIKRDKGPCIRSVLIVAPRLTRGSELALGLPQRRAPPLTRAQLLGQLVAARLPVELVLRLIDPPRLLQHLARDLLIAAIGIARRARRDLGAVDRDHPNPNQPGRPAEPQHLAEEIGQGPLVAHPELGDGGVIGHQVGTDHPIGHVLRTRPLDPARGAVSLREGVEQQRDHHLRVVGGAAVAIGPVVGIEAAQVHVLDRGQDRPHQVILRQPLKQRRRHQKHLLTITFDELGSHAGIVFGAPDGTLFPTATPQSGGAVAGAHSAPSRPDSSQGGSVVRRW
jgi:hypothetical protein